MKNLERFKAAVEKFGYDQKEYTDNGFGTENLIFVGDIERAVLFMQHEHGDDDFEWHPGRVRINADSAVIKREYMSVEEDDTETCRTW